MENLGALSILLAFCLSIFAAVAALAGKYGKRPFLVVSAQRAVYSVWILLTIASGLLVYSLLIGDYRLAYVVGHSNKAMSPLYKFTAWWGGQEGSLLLWSWLLATYSALAVWTNRRKFRAMMPIVVAIMMVTEAFFISMITFVVSPFQVLMVGNGHHRRPDGNGLESAAAVVDHGHPSAHALSGLCGLHCALCLRHGFARNPSTGRGLDSYHAPLGHRHLAVSNRRNHARHGMGLRGSRVGRLLGLGSGRKCFGHALDHRHRVPSFRHDAGKEGNDEGVEYGAGLGHLPAQHSGHHSYPHRPGPIGSRLCAVARQAVLHYVPVYARVLVALAITPQSFVSEKRSKLESVVSRESSFLFNNLILLASCFAILWGTLFPVIMEAITGEKETIDSPYYIRVKFPSGFFCCSSPESAP